MGEPQYLLAKNIAENDASNELEFEPNIFFEMED